MTAQPQVPPLMFTCDRGRYCDEHPHCGGDCPTPMSVNDTGWAVCPDCGTAAIGPDQVDIAPDPMAVYR